MASVTINNAGKHYGAFQALKGLSVDIADGEFVILVGPSGCGKSTLLRMIAGLEEITSGEIEIGNRLVNDLPPKERDIAMVFQSYALYPHMTVAQNMGFSLKLKGIPKTGDRCEGQPRGRNPRPAEPAQPPSAPALRRPAPARRHGPRDRARPAGVPLR